MSASRQRFAHGSGSLIRPLGGFGGAGVEIPSCAGGDLSRAASSTLRNGVESGPSLIMASETWCLSFFERRGSV
jgi:hypothetical protein